LGQVATLDCRLVPLPNLERVQDYFLWRQEDAHRNALNSHCYWLLRKEGMGVKEATEELEGKSVGFKNELLFSRGINFDKLPSWQKRGIGVFWADVEKTGYNPITKEEVKTTKKALSVNYELPLGEEYAKYVISFLGDK
jgi:tRNA(His) 5'-end guanylyltransferase